MNTPGPWIAMPDHRSREGLEVKARRTGRGRSETWEAHAWRYDFSSNWPTFIGFGYTREEAVLRAVWQARHNDARLPLRKWWWMHKAKREAGR